MNHCKLRKISSITDSLSDSLIPQYLKYLRGPDKLERHKSKYGSPLPVSGRSSKAERVNGRREYAIDEGKQLCFNPRVRVTIFSS
jgi:hypothetical protein